MSAITSVFKPNHKALVAYVTAGFTGRKATVQIAAALAEAGCDIIELGIPFSDPMADGTTIQQASYQALQHGITPQVCLEIAADVRKKIETPLVFMTYYNPVLNYGLDSFCQASAKAGINGLIVPDLPPDEGLCLEAVAQKNNLDLIYLLAPTSTDERITTVAARSRGFIYLVSLTGVTGARNTLSPELKGFVKRVRSKTALPLCVGFGISNAEHAVEAAVLADGVIIGSKLIELIEEDASLITLKSFIAGVRKALDAEKNTGEV
jgi:tryptophan synthase alpha chain